MGPAPPRRNGRACVLRRVGGRSSSAQRGPGGSVARVAEDQPDSASRWWRSRGEATPRELGGSTTTRSTRRPPGGSGRPSGRRPAAASRPIAARRWARLRQSNVSSAVRSRAWRASGPRPGRSLGGGPGSSATRSTSLRPSRTFGRASSSRASRGGRLPAIPPRRRPVASASGRSMRGDPSAQSGWSRLPAG